MLPYGTWRGRDNLIGPAWVMCPSLSQSSCLSDRALPLARQGHVTDAGPAKVVGLLCGFVRQVRGRQVCGCHCARGRHSATLCLVQAGSQALSHCHRTQHGAAPKSWPAPGPAPAPDAVGSSSLFSSSRAWHSLPRSPAGECPPTPCPGCACGEQSLLSVLNTGMGCWAMAGLAGVAKGLRSVRKLLVSCSGAQDRVHVLTAYQNRPLEHLPQTAQRCMLPALPGNGITAQAQKNHKAPGRNWSKAKGPV